MAKKPLNVLFDTNILISAHVFGGQPEKAYNLILEKQIIAVTSPFLIGELTETLLKKFGFELRRVKQFEKNINKYFKIIYPSLIINILKDTEDNRVLEAAVEGNCDYIITGDKELLNLGIFRGIKIVSAKDFLKQVQE